MDNSKVQLIINDDVDNKSIVSFDNSAIDAWQEVRIPIKILDDNIKSIKLEFLEKSEKNIKIVDMKLYYSSTYKTMVTNGTTWACLDEIQKIIYINQDGIEGEIILDDENFITEKDLQMTYMHKFKLYGNSNDLNNYYPLYLNDATKQLIVSSSKFYCKKNGVIKEFPIIFGNDDYSSKINVQNTRAQYFIESLSPDGNVYIYNIPHFLKSFKIDGVLYDCLCNITEGNKNIKGSDEHECSFKVECIDLTGKKVLTRDEYGVVIIYKYNNNGVLKNKILTSEKNTSNKIVYNMESELNTENDSNEYLVKIEDNSKTQINTKYDLRGNLLCTSMVGLENQESHEYVQKYSYSNLDNFLLSVKDNLGGINNIRYDEMGRIIEISPKKFNDPNYYGFKFKYDDFSEPTHLYYTFKQGNEVIDIILVEKIIDRTNNTVITKYYREDSSELNADIRKVVLDSYGDIQKIIIGDKKITYKNHQLWESPHSANVETIEDEFDNKTYSYKYDDYNNLTKYSIKDENGTINVYKSDNDTIECEENFTKSHFNPSAGIATIKYEEDILFAPRIKETTHQIYYGYQGNPTTYDYDDLGRLNKKYVSYIDGFIHFVNMTQNINFLEKTNCIKKISTSFTDENKKSTTFQSEYKYDQYGNLEEDHLSIDNNTDKFLRKYKYNEANQIIREEIVNSNITYEYYYNNDGSIDYIKTNGIQKNYNYLNGRVSLITEGGLVKIPITYDNIGNVKTFGANSYSWTRGNLLESFCNNNSVTKYHYNGFNKKYKKELSNGIIINYNYDNDKIISENWSNGNQLKFSYDATGITGFLYKENEGIMNNYYYFVKDAFGSVISLIYDGKEVAHYEYDSFGNCTVTNYTDEKIGDINPIRWKGMYYEIESGVYLIGNDTYCPSLRQNISMKLLEDIVTSDYEIYNIYPYQLTNSNMLNMTFEQNNLLSSLELVYEPEKKSKWTRFWEKFWRSIFGKIISVCLAIIAFALTWWQGGWLGVLFLAIPLVITLGVGCLAAGIASKRTGKGFWNGFVNHLNRNWSQVIGTEMALYLISFGISKLMKLGTTADCFKAGTLVLTSIGLIKIEDIKEGDKVWSYNEDTKETELKTVKRIFINKTQEWLYITIVNSETMRENEIVCTKAHRIYIKNKGWIKASEILENDEVLLYNNIKGKVIKKELKKLSKEEYTYNFEVEDNHNYYVGNDRILVHNKCKHEFEVLEFDERAIAMAREGNPTFQTFKRRLFKYQNEIDPTLFSSYKKGLSPTINNKKIILHHPKGRVGPNLYNVVGVTYQ